MNAVTFPKDLEAWAEAEVAAGRAQSVEQVATRALRGYRQALEAFRRSLDEASAEVRAGGGHPADQVFSELLARYGEGA